MKQHRLNLAAAFGISLFTFLGVIAVGVTIAPAEAEARCYKRWKRSWRCVTRYGRRHCKWHSYSRRVCTGRDGSSSVYSQHTSTSSTCRWRNVRKRYCYRTRGRRVSKYGYYYSRGGGGGRWGYRYRYIPGRRICNYRTYRQRVCY